MVFFGIDRVIEGSSDLPRGARIGMVTSDVARPAAAATVKSRVALRDAGFNLVRLFGPEHGLGGVAEDGAPVSDAADPLTGLPVVSLYGAKLRPPAESLEDLDAVVFDIPDVGARFYTYIWTLSHVLDACAQACKPLWVLDRPNPLGGDLAAAEGPMLDESQLSTFVGRWNMPIRHSLTAGELARLWNGERRIGCELHVVSAVGWARAMHWPDVGWPFVPTSPAMPRYESALLYPGTCLVEGTNLSEGRGTEAPFRIIGAPWVDGEALARSFRALGLPGVAAKAISFQSTARKYAGEPCGGVRLDVMDRRAVRPVAAGLHLIACAIANHPDAFSFSPDPRAAPGAHFDRLVGNAEVRRSLQADPDPSPRIAAWTTPMRWSARVQPHLLYD